MIRIISGIPGSGKTLLAVHFMYLDTCVNGYENYIKSCKEIEKLNCNGFKFDYPKQHHTTYFNGQVRFCPSCRPVKSPYLFNPWDLGLPGTGKDVCLFFPGAKIYIDEAQRFYNSRKSNLFPNFVSRFYELHRHWGLDITLIAQRCGLIDLNIREIATEFLHIEKLEKEEDSLGNLKRAIWHVRKFENNSDLEHYLDGHKELGIEEVIECNENLYKFYDTKFYRFLFLNKINNQVFSQAEIHPFKTTPKVCDILSDRCSATPPPNYYAKGEEYGEKEK